MSTVLTENIVLSRTRQHDLSRVRKLNCWGSELSDVSIVERMPHVEVLSLTINNITTLRDFASCKNLQELYLRKNKICDLNELYYIQELPNLKKLTLSENPCAEHPNYRYTVIRALPYLELLDNVVVTPEGKIETSVNTILQLFSDFHSFVNLQSLTSLITFSKHNSLKFFLLKNSQPDYESSSGLKTIEGEKSL